MKNRLFVCGDVHLPTDISKLNAKNFPEQKELTKDDVLVQLGDFGGLWFPIGSNKEQEYWMNWLANKNFTTAVVLGNHENYDIIGTLPWETKWGNEVQFYEIENGNKIYFFKRGAVYNINGRKVLTIGGALSVDKLTRVEGVTWWKQEDITYKEIESCFVELDEKGYEVDYVFTHTCPARLVGELLWYTDYTEDKFNDFTAKFLDEIDNRVEFKEWHFGHFHTDYTITEDTTGGGTDFYRCHYNDSPMELE